MFFKRSILALTFLVFPIYFFGQAVKSSNTDWKNYRLRVRDISVSLPKLPVLYYENDACRGFERRTYAAYADEVVYTAVVTSATKEKPPSWCDVKQSFSRKTLDLRIGELIIWKALGREGTSLEPSKRTLLIGERDHVLVVDDIENGRFVELWITHNKGLRVDKNRFWDSLELMANASAIDVNEGADHSIGDITQKTYSDESWEGLKFSEVGHNYYLAHKPRARYTEAARSNEVEGTVRLKITLLASGTVGTITPITSLPHGLTEQAIYAARRIVFIPKKVKGMNVSVIVTFDYSFSIY